VDDQHRTIFEGRCQLPRIGEVRQVNDVGSVPYLVVDGDGESIEPFETFLQSLC
jgi:hypothetical protein